MKFDSVRFILATLGEGRIFGDGLGVEELKVQIVELRLEDSGIFFKCAKKVDSFLDIDMEVIANHGRQGWKS